MPTREWLQQTLSKGWKILTEYPKRQAAYLARPDKFTAGLDFALWETKKDAFAVLVLGGTLSLLINTINVHFYGERIQRIIELQDKTVNEMFLLAAVGAFTLFIFIPFRLLGGSASLLTTLIVITYAVAFTAPVATLLVVLVTRVASWLLNADLVVIPPLKIVQLSFPVRSNLSTAVVGTYSTILFLWNAYLCWVLWLALRAVNKFGRLRGGIGLAIAVALLFILAKPLGFLTIRAVEALKPLLEWVL